MFGSSSKQLIDDFTELARSLGAIVTFGKPYYPHYFKNGEKIISSYLTYRVGIRLPENIKPFHCIRKASSYQGPASGRSNGGLVRAIKDIHYVGKSKVKCIAVDNKQQRFVIENSIVSSNSAKSTILGLFTYLLASTSTVLQELPIPSRLY